MIFKNKTDEEINAEFPKDLNNLDKTKKLAEKLNKNICPGCGTKDEIHEGPHGGMAVNIVCKACGRWFWIAPHFGAYFLRQEPKEDS